MPSKKLLIIGHRGYGATNRRDNCNRATSLGIASSSSGESGYNYRLPKRIEEVLNYPENSLLGFKNALEAGADGIELDVYLTTDGVPVVIHDDELNLNIAHAERDRGNLGLVSEKTLAELRQHNLGYGLNIPTLEEVLDMVETQNELRKTKDLRVIIELKGPNTARAVHEAFEHYTKTRGWKPEQFTVCSFKYDYLRNLRALNPDIRIGPGIKSRFLFGDDGVGENYEVLKREYQPDAIGRLKELHDEIDFHTLFPVTTDLKREMAAFAKKEGLEIIAWTWNEKPPHANKEQLNDLFKLRKTHDDIHIMTDYPRSMRQWVRKYKGDHIETTKYVSPDPEPPAPLP